MTTTTAFPRLTLEGRSLRHLFAPGEGGSAAPGPATSAAGRRAPTAAGQRISHLLVPLDGSPLAECVLPFAEQVVAATGARLTLLRVVEPPSRSEAVIDALDWEMLRAAAHAYLTRVAGRLAEHGTTARVELAQGHPAEQILSWIREHAVDLVVLASHGEGGLTGWTLASTADKILRRANASLLVIPAYCDQAEAPAAETPAADRPAADTRAADTRAADTRAADTRAAVRVRRIVVPLDTSPRAESVLPFAVQLARHRDAELVLSHVVLEPEMPRHAPLSGEDRALAARLTARNREEAERYLEGLRQRLADQRVRVRARLEVASRCAPTLRAVVDEEQADLVLLCAHGHSADPNEPQGDVPTRLVHCVGRPVLIVQDMPAGAATAAGRAAEEHPGH